MPSDKLERLTAELVALAEQVRRECSGGEEPGASAVSADSTMSGHGQAGGLDEGRQLAEALYRCRRRRDRLFGPIFGEPAWDILLDLFVMEGRGTGVPVSSACIASGASHSTALRQIEELVRLGLVERIRDEHDKRRTYLKLSGQGLHTLTLVLEPLAHECGMRVQGTTAATR